MQTTSFKILLEDYARHTRQPYSGLSLQDQELLCGDLNAGARWLWNQAHSLALPDMLESKTVTLAAGGLIEAEEIEDSTFWSVWREDPRLVRPGQAISLCATGQGNGDVLMHGESEDTEVFVFYKRPVLRWTFEREAAGEEMPIGALFWNDGDASRADDGHVYKALEGPPATTSNFGNSLKWEQIYVPVSMVDLLILAANEERLRLGSNVPGAAALEYQKLDLAWHAAYQAASRDFGKTPWLVNQNQ
jgi:hypothetical protein